jgi:anti-anti-sigma factor
MNRPAAEGAALFIFTSRELRSARVTLAGELDVTSADCLGAWARQLAGEPVTAVWMDVSGLRFVDVSGLRALVRACALLEQRCGSVELAGVPRVLSHVAELTGMELLSACPRS